jgi:iron complex transport system ATP-binding protein
MTISDGGVMVAENLRFAYHGGPWVLDGLSAAIDAGRVTALIGPNAVGKTTLLRLLMGQLTPAGGSVRLDGRLVHQLPPRRRAAWISYVPQRSSTSFAFTVEQVVAMGRYALPQDPAAVAQAMETADLLKVRHRIFRELSAGQQQRVLLARSLAQTAGEGRAVLLDEPGSAMDLYHVHRLMETLAALSRSGRAVLVVLHDLNLAARYADAVWLMHEGRLVASGSWQEVLRPSVLEPVYRVRLRPLADSQEDRPVFVAELE